MDAGTWGDVPGVALDLPGHAGVPRTSPNVPAYATALLPKLPEARVTLIGHSLGGMIAVEMARQLGPRCAGVAMIDAPLWLPCGPFLRFAPLLAEITSRVPGPKGIERVIARRTAPGPGRAFARNAMARMTRGGLRDAMKAAISYDARPALAALHCPILALWAERTTITNTTMRQTFEDLQPHATSVTIETGHMAHLDNRELVMSHINTFLEKAAA